MNLRPYQASAIDKLRAAFAQGHKRVILCAPTGAGKTVIFSAIAQGAMLKGKRVMIITDRGELLWQAGGALNKAGFDRQKKKFNSFPRTVYRVKVRKRFAPYGDFSQ